MLVGAGSLDGGEEEGLSEQEGGAMLQGVGQGKGEGGAGSCKEVLQVALWVGAGGKEAGSRFSRLPMAARMVRRRTQKCSMGGGRRHGRGGGRRHGGGLPAPCARCAK